MAPAQTERLSARLTRMNADLNPAAQLHSARWHCLGPLNALYAPAPCRARRTPGGTSCKVSKPSNPSARLPNLNRLSAGFLRGWSRGERQTARQTAWVPGRTAESGESCSCGRFGPRKGEPLKSREALKRATRPKPSSRRFALLDCPCIV